MPEESVELNMVLVIDTLGKRYGMLPSEVMTKANTFDIFIMDAAITYENHVHQKSNSKNKHMQQINKPVTDDSMLEQYKKFKDKK